ncbi:hypothetical protein B0H67DRAFT_687817 [Lasiosphaeris hirsuta]|uniref:Uncharacterized protein n=1 Tax=Lasiosphaeris hirsuta TaxID=260670 RepID=A0AA39ZY10_9PEZI|nr:hypothetical protein B0H67DRAFT_687817 [Lasiosphaeris hirsuta]
MAPLSPLLTLSTLLSPTSAIPSPRAACVAGQTLPGLWTIGSMTIAYTPDELARSGNATFTLTSSLTSPATTETVRCALRFNSLCELAGTPADPDLHLWLQVNLQVASVTVNHPWACDGVAAGASYVAGTADVVLECPEESLDDGLVCVGGGGRVDGSVVLPEAQGGEWGGVGGWAAGKYLVGAARRGRAMAHALAHIDTVQPGSEKAGADKFEPARFDPEEREKSKEEAGQEVSVQSLITQGDEKVMIDELEHRLCSPSCRNEAIPGPASGVRYGTRKATRPVTPEFKES